MTTDQTVQMINMNLSKTERIELWNTDLAFVLIPNNVILAIYIFLGFCGNGIVMFTYKMKFSGKNVDRYFIPYLALTDLLASSVCGSFGIALNTMQTTFYNNAFCKAGWFFAALTTYVSMMLLLAIAVQRYLKIVRPFGPQMGRKHHRITLAISFAIPLLCAVPIPFLYGSVPFESSEEDLVGRRCSRIKDGNKAFSLFYGGLIGLIAIAIVGSLLGIYLRIGWTIFSHMKYGNKSTESVEDGSSTQVTSFDDSKEIKEPEYKNDAIKSFGITANNTSGKWEDKNVVKETLVNRKRKNLPRDQHEKINRRIMIKFTLMFMIITIIFLISYIPKVIIMLFEALNKKFWESFNDRHRAVMLFIYRMYIINNISNPFVYAFLDLKFKNELKSLCCNKKV